METAMKRLHRASASKNRGNASDPIGRQERSVLHPIRFTANTALTRRSEAEASVERHG